MNVFLETRRLFIKPPSLLDYSNWQQLHSNKEVMKFISGIPDSEIIKQWLEHDILHFKKHGFSMGSVYLKQTNKFIGRAGLVYFNYDDNQSDIEVGFLLDPKFWNNGYGFEITLALVRWAFDHSIPQLIAAVHPDNDRARHTLEKAGMYYDKLIDIDNEKRALYRIFKKKYRFKMTHPDMQKN